VRPGWCRPSWFRADDVPLRAQATVALIRIGDPAGHLRVPELSQGRPAENWRVGCITPAVCVGASSGAASQH